MKVPPQIQEIANIADVTRTTASLVLNGHTENTGVSHSASLLCKKSADHAGNDLLADLQLGKDLNAMSIAIHGNLIRSGHKDALRSNVRMILDSMAVIADKVGHEITELFIGHNRRLGEFVSFRYRGLCFELYLGKHENSILQFGAVRNHSIDECKAEWLRGLVL